jgi:hypothetical protein
MNKKIKNSNGWILQGQCLQYYNRDCELSINELSVLISIMDRSFAFKKRYCYMSYSDFMVTNHSSLKKVLNTLVDKKLLSYTNTFKDNGHRGMNEYRILEPKKYINNFVFATSSSSDKAKTKEVEEEEEVNPWK